MSDMELPESPGEEAGASSQRPTPKKRPGVEGGGDGGGAQLNKRPGQIKQARGGGSAKGVIIINDESLPLLEGGLAERTAAKLPDPWECERQAAFAGPEVGGGCVLRREW